MAAIFSLASCSVVHVKMFPLFSDLSIFLHMDFKAELHLRGKETWLMFP